MTQAEYLSAMEQWADGERCVPEAFIGGLSNVYSHFAHWEAAANLIREGDRVLEAGCGCGLPARIYSLRSRRQVIAVDQDYAVKWSSVFYATPGVEFVAGDFNTAEWAIGRGPFDVVVCIDVLEHIREKDLFLRVLRVLSTDETRYILSVPIGREEDFVPNPWHLHFWPTHEDLLADVGRFLAPERVTRI
jgi:2-polyprenyl-3-methyl-5-hydroxy-6-metoxy-1,4-benzoquinol methylase